MKHLWKNTYIIYWMPYLNCIFDKFLGRPKNTEMVLRQIGITNSGTWVTIRFGITNSGTWVTIRWIHAITSDCFNTPLWNLKEMTAHRECLDILERVCPGCVLRWAEPTTDDMSRLPTNIDAALVGEEANPTTLLLLAHICAALDSVPEWLPWVQASDTLSAAGAAGAHAWGLMLPTSTRTPGVNYTSSVAVRYPPLNRRVGDNWIVGTHSSGGLEGLVGGYQLVIWKKPSKEFMHARGADLSSVIEPLLQDLIDIHGDDSSVLVMCARNEDRDQLLTDSICRGHPQIKVQSVASSAGATATASIVNQPVNGRLNGRPTDPFDQEECYARCTVAATRAQSLTIIISQLDMAGIMGMMQVLAARARPTRSHFGSRQELTSQ